MKASLQDQIAPPVSRNKVSGQLGADAMQKQLNPEKQVDFREVLLNSNDEAAKTRLAQKNGGLADAKSYDDFLKNLNKATEQTRAPKNNLDKDDFLTLFVTQLQNQDPLNPKDGAEMASQLAQFNSLEQMLNVNKTLKSLEDKTQAKNDQSLVGFLGKEAFVGDGRVALKNGSLADATFKTEHALGKTLLTVKDAAGQTVYEGQMGPQEPGVHNVEWNGVGKDGQKVPDGVYTISLSGEGNDNTKVDVPVQTKVSIEGLDLKEAGQTFYSNLGKLSYQDLIKVGNAGFSQYEKQKAQVPQKPETAQKTSDLSVAPQTPLAQNASPKGELMPNQPFSTLPPRSE